ncbi:BTAD domain-containing putative transcriptional regulator [Jatrophihabitans endophyticus]|uniref:AfsR/SARP family transcriptional regulator n=1 Tax=Jatrophihabitans endophyticus TaxID=1206085 RepID=UPI0019F9087E|nr:BTAD domain-containing putative transcriptional regulator [Jatrophihabitans endophyticus]MBE7187571.1 winged helix-turn-helix domain-containing protein [Jatrophihabitans endophyticus]
MQIAILGPFEVRDDAGDTVPIAGARLRSLIARLAVDPGRWVSTGALVDAVWGDEPPADEANALQTLVSRARRALHDPSAIASSTAGYRLAVAPDAVDAARFEALVRSAAAAARDGRDADAAAGLEDALALWRGPAVPEAAGGPLAAEATRLAQLRATARADLARLRVAAGTPDLAELEALTVEQPLDEALTVLHMQALAAAGRQADALAAYESLRARLADELGVDPSGPTRAAHLELLRGEQAAPTTPTPAAPRRSNLRTALTSFVGRDAEQQAIRDRFASGARLVTLVGPGGAGKTRLATESARGLFDEAPDGVWVAELAAVTAGADVAQAVFASIGLRELHSADQGTMRDATARLTSVLAGKRLVVVLDNCEHVIDAAAELTETLLGECPGLRVLATSREPLGIGGESLFPVPPLPRPTGDVGAADAATFASVALFADRAASVRPGFVLDAGTVGPVVEIVLRLDGLPLAIELAAARLRSMALEDVAARLSDRFRLLTGGSRTALPRHRTLHAVVEWSWDLLQPDERHLVERLAVFPAGVTADSATAVRPDDVGELDVPDLLAALVDKSLLQPVGDGRRLRMLETIREYGIERLAEQGVLDEARRRHARYFAALLRESIPKLVSRDQLPWFALLRAELENAVAAMRYLVSVGDADAALQAAVDLSNLALLVGGQDDAAGWLSDALAAQGGDPRLRTIAEAVRAVSTDFSMSNDVVTGNAELRRLAEELGRIDVSFAPMLAVLRPGVAFIARDLELARRLLDEAMQHPDPWTRAAARLFSVNLYENEGETDLMRAEAERALDEFRVLGERWGISSALRSLGQVRTLEGDLDAAAELYAESMQLRQELASQDDTVFLLVELADLALRRGDEVGARDYLTRATEQAEGPSSDFESVFAWTMVAQLERRGGDRAAALELAAVAGERLARVPRNNPMQNYVRAMYFRLAGELALDAGDRAEAERHAQIAYEASVGTHDLPVIASGGVFAAELDEAAGDPAAAARRLGAADRLRGAPDPLSPDIAPLIARLRGALGDEAVEAGFDAGRALDRDAAIAALDPSRVG